MRKLIEAQLNCYFFSVAFIFSLFLGSAISLFVEVRGFPFPPQSTPVLRTDFLQHLKLLGLVPCSFLGEGEVLHPQLHPPPLFLLLLQSLVRSPQPNGLLLESLHLPPQHANLLLLLKLLVENNIVIKYLVNVPEFREMEQMPFI